MKLLKAMNRDQESQMHSSAGTKHYRYLHMWLDIQRLALHTVQTAVWVGAILIFFTPDVQSDDLDDAFAKLVQGRSYLKGFPDDGTTRLQVVDRFLGINNTPKRPSLVEAVERAIAIRQSEPPDSNSLDGGQVPRSRQAQVIAWESMESLLTGYLYAGNKDLLEGVRVAYPGGKEADDPRELPKEESQVFPGASQKNLAYARLYFLQGIKDVLEYVSKDSTGELRAGSSIYPTVPHFVSFDEEKRDEILDHDRFDDPNFGGAGVQDREASQSIAYLHGSAMERYGLSVVAYADQLWRSAYAGPGAGLKRSDTEKGAMLARAADALKQDVHAQFLASLPVAARLGDGSDGKPNEYQQAKIDQASVSVTDAIRLRDRIIAGEKPTETALVSAWHPVAIEEQIGRTKAAYDAALNKFEGTPKTESVVYALDRKEQAAVNFASYESGLRLNFETELLEITGVPPSDYGGLREESLRNAYLQAILEKYDRLINQRNPNHPELNDGRLMSIQALRLIQAIEEVVAKKAAIDGYALKMDVELRRNGDINAKIKHYGTVYGAIEAAVEIASLYDIKICTCGLNSGIQLNAGTGAFTRAVQVLTKELRKADETVTINSLNSDATISNLLIDQQIAIEQLPGIQLASSIAGAELKRLYNRAVRLVEDHAFQQENSKDLWYRDPALAFRLDKAEEEYGVLMQAYRIELYKLAKMLGQAWIEEFRNPVKDKEGRIAGLGSQGEFDDFTEPESVFSIRNHEQGKRYYNALRNWSELLGTIQYRGVYDGSLRDVNSFSGQPISLRRDIMKLIDYRKDQQANTYVVDPELSRQSIQQFRALLLDSANRDPVNANGFRRLRIDFPFNYNQSRVIPGESVPRIIVLQNRPGGSIDTFWNHRVKEIGVRIKGRRVFPAGNSVPVNIDLYGSVDRISYALASVFTFERKVSTFSIPLFQRDPDQDFSDTFFGTPASGIDAAIESAPLVMAKATRSWPLFCDRIVLRIDSQQGSMRIENMEDIEFTMNMEVGPPPPVPSNVW